MKDKSRILVVDDDHGTRRTLKLILRRKGHVVETASTGREGIEEAQKRFFNIALLDIKLPDMQGVDLLTPLQELQPDMALIMITGYASVKTAVQALNERASAYITKPLDMDEVLAKIEETLNRQRLVEEKRRAEQELRELNASLEREVEARTAEVVAEKEKVDAILRSVSDAIVMTDGKGCLQYANPALATLTGYTTQEIFGQSIDLLFEGTTVEQVYPTICSILEEGKAWRGGARGRRKDGRSYDAALSVDPIRGTAGNHMGYVVSFRDVSEERALERARSRFLTNVSHQFRTPIATLKLYVELIGRSELSEEDLERLVAMEEEIDRLIQLMEGVLEMAALDSEEVLTTREPISLQIVIENIITRYLDRAEEAELTLEAAPLPPDLPAVEGRPRRLAQAVNKVVENAILYTPPGGRVTLEVEISEDEGRTWVVIAVRDTGPGVLPQEQGKVFDRFFRGSLAQLGDIPGIGLGLSIAQAIMHAHGGRITLESGEAGSTFRLWLPVAAA